MTKKILFNPQETLLKGIKTLSDAVGSTLGPLGNNVALDKSWGVPNVIHDGVLVAREIEVEDPFENIGVKLVKEAASKTNDLSGDGTTTSTILAYELVKLGFASKSNPMKLRKGMKIACEKLVKNIKAKSIPVKDLKQVASISAQDEQIGELIAQAFNKVGKDGVITTEEGKGTEISVEYKEGMQFDKGYASAYFVTNTEKMEAEITNCHVLIINDNLLSLEKLAPFLEKFVRTSKNLLIIANEIEGEALASLVLNKIRGNLNVLAVKSPGFGERRTMELEDIAILTQANVISSELGKKIEDIEMEDLGFVKKVITTQNDTTLIGAEGDTTEQIAKIRKQIELTNSDFDREKYQERLAKLTTGVAVINVGATTEPELIEKKERVTDAIAATRASLEEGILPGGAISYIQLWEDIEAVGETKEGIELVKSAIQKPFRVLMENSGLEATPPTKFGIGIDVMDGKEKDMVKEGIIDPAKVLRTALENAVSVASVILTTKVLVADIPNKDEMK
jgi:chaperonin GroEL